MDAVRNSDLIDRIAFYKNDRILDQARWYSSKARYNGRRTVVYSILLITSSFFAIIATCLKIYFGNKFLFSTDIFAGLPLAIFSWLQSKKFQELASSYTLTANEISLLALKIEKIKKEQEFESFVADAESAFSREHTQWQARREMP